MIKFLMWHIWKDYVDIRVGLPCPYCVIPNPLCFHYAHPIGF